MGAALLSLGAVLLTGEATAIGAGAGLLELPLVQLRADNMIQGRGPFNDNGEWDEALNNFSLEGFRPPKTRPYRHLGGKTLGLFFSSAKRPEMMSLKGVSQGHLQVVLGAACGAGGATRREQPVGA